MAVTTFSSLVAFLKIIKQQIKCSSFIKKLAVAGERRGTVKQIP